LQTIQALPGIQSINETVSDINVRGGTNDQNLVFWDGIKMYQSGHFFGLISAFNPYLIKDVVLIKNGTSSALSDGVSSTIDIRTDNQVSQTFSGGAGINMLNADLFLKIPVARNVSIQLSGRRSISDIVQTPTYEQYFNRIFRNTDVTNSTDPAADSLVGSDERFNFYDISAKLLYDITPKDKLRINFLKVFNTINYEENALIDNEPETKTSGLDQESLATGLYYSRSWSDKLLTTAQLYYSAYELGAINFDVLNDQRLIQENKVLDTGIKLDARLDLSSAFDLLTGYQFYEIGVSNLVDINNPVYRRLIKKVLRNHALFAEGNYSSVSGNTHLRIGLRANYFEKYNQLIIEPRLAFTQRFLNNFSVEILGEMKSQSTTQVIDLQNDFLGVEKRRWILANEEDIPIVKSKHISAGLRYQPGNLLISLEGYLKQVDGITSSSQGFQNQFQYIRSSGNYYVHGLDFLINQRFGFFNTWLSYSYADNTYDFPEFAPSVFPNNLDIRHTATFGSSYQINNFQVSVGINWRTGKPVTLPAEISDGEIIYEKPNSSRLDDYLRVDLSAKYLFKISERVQG
ncbi:MAG: TonB-dependent receptor plug domain-containing protein, partial [Cyclobacteriaceae bacterium]|nr:TonB-dependent receptor plug domain-containing protein [Cyclobacteriaceae bacterium]